MVEERGKKRGYLYRCADKIMEWSVATPDDLLITFVVNVPYVFVLDTLHEHTVTFGSTNSVAHACPSVPLEDRRVQACACSMHMGCLSSRSVHRQNQSACSLKTS